MALWETHVGNVEPLCKILHIPSTTKMVERASKQSEMASEIEECLLFATYHFAVFTRTQEEVAERTGESRMALLRDYNFATRQALVKASFLKSTKLIRITGCCSLPYALSAFFMIRPHSGS